MNLKKVNLSLGQPFTIARGTKETVDNVVVELVSEGMVGYGEAAPNRRYDEDARTVVAYLERLGSDLFQDLEVPEELEDRIERASEEIGLPVMQSAKAALEMAWLDWWGKKQDQPLWELWGISADHTPPTSYTIGLDKIDVMQQKVEAAVGYPILKVKLGTGRDQQIIEGIREVTNRKIRVDANEGWTSLDEAKHQIEFLAQQDIEFVEQPMPASRHREMRSLKAWSPLPLVADESFMGHEDLDILKEMFDAINIKLSKIGSLMKGRRVLKRAHSKEMKVMVGCMIESSLGIAGAALLGAEADYVDLDGNLLIDRDPFQGLVLDDRKCLHLGAAPGLGITPVH
ncbi:dipeptide epimerase [Fodinibius sediminis]|nr:dipeptide epimerase [Fodinibius sediminis]